MDPRNLNTSMKGPSLFYCFRGSRVLDFAVWTPPCGRWLCEWPIECRCHVPSVLSPTLVVRAPLVLLGSLNSVRWVFRMELKSTF